ncbi:exopolysaccharide transport family protein [Pedobacter antarcticus]|uniref:exopolysaccharide transport family protein n=1 Tax=Pedobacter antarcticus TaxID=34086 RepID=UPI001C58E98D|nr:lipopolysaccharide biosynthesis protein [Pedobacter antarcticus]
MDIKRFFKLLGRYKWILIFLPLASIILTYFLVKDLPKKYISKTQISTGLIDQSQQISSLDNNADFFKVNSQFSNIMEIMRMDKTTSMLGYQLILHDLQDPAASFNVQSPEIKSLDAQSKSRVINEYKRLAAERAVITPALNGDLKLYDILVSMGYDLTSLHKGLVIYHVENSDFITIEFSSNNPQFSSYVVNTLSNEFISMYGIDVSNNQNKSNVVLDSVVKQKERIMNDKNAALKNYKINNGVLNLDKQSELIYSQINDYEQKKSENLREIQANQGAINSIDKRLSGKDQLYSGGNVIADNNRIVNLKNELKIANDRYVNNNFKPADKKRIDSLQNVLTAQITNSSDKYVADPTANKQSLITQKMNLEVALDLAKSSIRSIDAQLTQLKAKYTTMVPFDAGVQNFERDADVATKEYLEVLNRSNTNSLEKNIGLRLHVAQAGFPGVAEPSKTVLFIALAGVASFMICFMGILVLFLLDNSINTTAQLQRKTGNKIVGKLNVLKNNDLEIREIWKNESAVPAYVKFKDNLRSLRFEIDQAMTTSDSKVLGITSLNSGEGKTFVASSLVYALAMMGRKVLLIKGEEEHNQVVNPAQKVIPEQFFETFIDKRQLQTEDLITVLNNKSDKTSLFEIQHKDNLKSGFSFLKDEFDFVIIDMNSLEKINRAKEWLMFCDKHIAVFASGGVINDANQEHVDYITKHEGFLGWVLNKEDGI